MEKGDLMEIDDEPDKVIMDVKHVLDQMLTTIQKDEDTEARLQELCTLINLMEKEEKEQQMEPNFLTIREIKALPDNSERLVTFIAKVVDVKTVDQDTWIHLSDESKQIIGVITKSDKCSEDCHTKFLREFKRVEKDTTSDDAFLLNVSAADWLLARRKKQIQKSNQCSVEMINTEVFVIGTMGEYKYQKCIFIKKIMLCDKKIKEWVLRNMAIGNKHYVRH